MGSEVDGADVVAQWWAQALTEARAAGIEVNEEHRALFLAGAGLVLAQVVEVLVSAPGEPPRATLEPKRKVMSLLQAVLGAALELRQSNSLIH